MEVVGKSEELYERSRLDQTSDSRSPQGEFPEACEQ
jgi:hypothetical protein